MDLVSNNGRSSAEKILLASSGLLAFALGMDASKAHADLIVTSFDDAQKAALQAGDAVSFGPAGDTSGFTAQITSGFPFEFFALTGNGANTVATVPGCTQEPVNSSACLATFAPGATVDSAANFAPSGSFKTFGFDPIVGPVKAPDGNYFFGLDDLAGGSDPFGWLEVTVSSGNPALVQFAFEDTDGVGAPVPAAPEPGSLALFALGGSAVLAARRRRREASHS
jgi:hypothetical protein